jgi:hypothetical protein
VLGQRPCGQKRSVEAAPVRDWDPVVSHSPTRSSAWCITTSERYMPDVRNRSTTGRASEIRPVRLASRTSPSVPMAGIPRLRAHRRASPSSITAQAVGSNLAIDRTADSPGPRSQAAISGAISGSTIARIQSRLRITLTVGSSSPCASSSRSTATGTTTSLVPSRRISRRSARTRKTRGDMFTMRLMGKFNLLHQLVDVDLERWQLRRCKRINEVEPAHASQEGGLLMRDTSLGIPKHCRGQTHLAA